MVTIILSSPFSWLHGQLCIVGTLKEMTALLISVWTLPQLWEKFSGGSESLCDCCSFLFPCQCVFIQWLTGVRHMVTAIILVDEFVWICFASLGIEVWSLFSESVGLIGFRDEKVKGKQTPDEAVLFCYHYQVCWDKAVHFLKDFNVWTEFPWWLETLPIIQKKTE